MLVDLNSSMVYVLTPTRGLSEQKHDKHAVSTQTYLGQYSQNSKYHFSAKIHAIHDIVL